MKSDILAQVLAWVILAARGCLRVTLTIPPFDFDEYEMNDVRSGTRCGKPSSSVAAPILYALRAARRRRVTVRSAAPEHVRMRRRTLRAARNSARGATSYSAKNSSASAAADDVTTPSPLGPMAERSRPPNILSAAAEGVGAFHAAQTAALKSCSAGFAVYLAAYLEQASCTDAITSKELLPMPRPFNAPMGRAPRSSRRRARWAATRAALVMANQAAAAVSWLACGSPSGA